MENLQTRFICCVINGIARMTGKEGLLHECTAPFLMRFAAHVSNGYRSNPSGSGKNIEESKVIHREAESEIAAFQSFRK